MNSKALCPQCSFSPLHRSHRKNALDLVMRLFGKAPMRCYSCYKRYYMPVGLSKENERAEAERDAHKESSAS